MNDMFNRNQSHGHEPRLFVYSAPFLNDLSPSLGACYGDGFHNTSGQCIAI